MDLFAFELVNSALLFGSKTLLDNIIYKNCSILEAFNSDFQFSFPVKIDCVFFSDPRIRQRFTMQFLIMFLPKHPKNYLFFFTASSHCLNKSLSCY